MLKRRELGTISLDGTKVHTDASKRKAVSYKRLQEMETQLQTEVEELFALSEQSEQTEVPDGLVVSKEIAWGSGHRGEWCLVCLAFNLKRFHTLSWE